MKGLLALAMASFAAVTMPAAASAAGRDVAAGAGRIGNDWFVTGASSGPLGERPAGMVVMHTTVMSDAGPVTTTFHGAVSQGCLIVDGSRAAVVGRIPEDEQVTFGPIGTIEYATLFVVDNGPPQDGRPVDLAFPDPMNPFFAGLACAGVFAPPFLLLPFEHGNFVVRDAVAVP
jgi:hypothetical protein